MLFEIYFSYFNIIDLVIDCYYMSFTGLNVLVAPLLTFSSFLIVSIEYIFFQIQNIFLLKLKFNKPSRSQLEAHAAHVIDGMMERILSSLQ